MAARRASRIEPDKLDRIIELRLRGVPVRQVAEQVDVAPSTVQRAWNRWLEDAAEEHAERLEQIRSEQVARYRRIAREAWERYDAAVRAYQLAEDAKASAMHHRVAVSALTEARNADREVDRILGLAAPNRTEVTGKDGGPIAMSDPKADLVALLDRLAPQDDPTDNGDGDG